MAVDVDRSLLVADVGNYAIRRVTMAGAGSTVAGNGEALLADGECGAARFNQPRDVAVDGKGTIVVANRTNNRIREIEGGQVTTLAGSSGGEGDKKGGEASVRRGMVKRQSCQGGWRNWRC